MEAQGARGAGGRLRGSPSEGRCTHEKEIRSLHAKIGQLVMDRDFLEAALER
ncbi:MAG: hypothetical protein OXN97_23615 [Bryobacterales bacterium]|nr:hypothetical protein [Bryobacterales bacterium]MDE0626686.1 hypothetical protein [Bryobacterales bacterium]